MRVRIFISMSSVWVHFMFVVNDNGLEILTFPKGPYPGGNFADRCSLRRLLASADS